MSALTQDRQHHGSAAATEPRDLLFQRYREMWHRVPERWNDTLASILSHKSVRRYLPETLPENTLELLVAAAQSASTSSNLQTWSVICVEDPERRARIAKIAGKQDFIEQCPLFLVWIADLYRLQQIASERNVPADGLDYFETFLVAVVDAGLAAQSAVVALESMGLGTVYIGAVRNDPQAMAVELGLPPLAMPLFGLCVGHPDPATTATVKPRLPQEVVLHRERYDWNVQRQAIARYDARMVEFCLSQGRPPLSWSDSAMQKLQNSGALHGRDRIRQILHDFGFKLR